MKVLYLMVGLLVLATGSAILLAEGAAFWTMKDKAAGFANAEGFTDAQNKRMLETAILSGNATMLGDVLARQRDKAPFDPVLMSLQAGGMVDRDIGVSVRLLDQAQAVAPRDPRVKALRDVLQTRLQMSQPSSSQLAE